MLLGLWNLKVLTKVQHNFRQYLNVCLFSHYSFIYKRETSVTSGQYIFLIAFVCLYSFTGFSSPQCTLIELKACNQFFTLDFVYICNGLVSFHFSLLCKFYAISNFKKINNKSFHPVLYLLSDDICLNPGPVYNSQ